MCNSFLFCFPQEDYTAAGILKHMSAAKQEEYREYFLKIDQKNEVQFSIACIQ